MTDPPDPEIARQIPESPARIIVVGSANIDLVVSVPHLPAAGETVLGGDLRQVAGGKGANQAVAAARLGASVVFIGRVGDDDYGRQTIVNLQQAGIDTQYLRMTPGVPSGVALISVSESGENSIVVAPGANGRLTAADVDGCTSAFDTAQAVVISLEIPMEAVAAAIRLGQSRGLRVILNPAPARPLPADLLPLIDILTPNEQEAELLGGVAELRAEGVNCVITTLGARGARLDSAGQSLHIPAPPVTAVDTVAAGDCFTGALAVELAGGADMASALRFAVHAASVKVTRHGAQPGMPTRSDIILPGV